MTIFTDLPVEIVSSILSFVDPADLPSCSLACRFLHHAIKDNIALFRALYFNYLDKPAQVDLDWIQEIQDLVKLRAICAGSDPAKARHLAFVFNTTTRLLARSVSQASDRPRMSITYADGRNVSLLRDCFANDPVREAFLCQSFLFQRARVPIKNFEQPKQLPTAAQLMSAKLHCLFGDMVLNYGRTRSSRTYPFACSKVYDLREYTSRTRWGPFIDEGPGPVGSPGNENGELGLPDDRVDWEKVEAIMIVLWYNIRSKGLDRLPVFEHFWKVPLAGCWPNSYIPLPLNREIKDLELEDPYDVTGTWLRVVCFLDFNDFFAYNFPQHDNLPDHLPRPIIDEIEALRLIIVKLHVTKVEPPGPEDGQSRPVVHFEGISRSLDSSLDDNANSDIRGTVRTTREGEVRWTTLSIFQGSERWRSESVQVGGIRSSKVIGNWFDKDYHPTGPCGPTAFWKIGDRHPSTADNQITAHDYLAILDGCQEDGAAEERLRRAHRPGYSINEEGGVLPSIFQVNSEDEEDQYESEMDGDEDDDDDDDEEEEEEEEDDDEEREEEDGEGYEGGEESGGEAMEIEDLDEPGPSTASQQS
ncbi:unnamed protein product [Discula destructiva]